MPSSHRRSRAKLQYLVALCVLVVGSAVALGSVHVATSLVVSAGALLLAVYMVRNGESVPRPTWFLWGLAAYSLIQAVPLPVSLLARIAPTNADVWSRAFLPLGEAPPTTASISLAPALSCLSAACWWCYGVVFWVASVTTRQFGRPKTLLVVVAASCSVAVLTLLHGLFGVTRVYGFYTPSFDVDRWLVGPLLNGNNLAGYSNVGAVTAAGLLLSRRRPAPRWVLVSALVLCSTMTLATRSGAGLIALLVGLGIAVLGYFAISRRLRRGLRLSSIAVLLTLLVGGGVLASRGASAWTASQGPDLNKFQLVSWSQPLIKDYPVLGVGRGGFESVFHAYSHPARDIAIRSPENFPVQWAAEWGIGIASIALLGLLYCMWTVVRQRSHLGARMGALGAAVALLLQNLADLGLEVPALCVLLSALLGGSSEAGSTTEGRRWSSFAGVGFGALAVALAVFMQPRNLEDERAEVYETYRSALQNRDEALINQRLRLAIERFPAEPYFSRVGALAAWRFGGNPMPWFQRALERGMANGRTHLMLADVLLDRGKTSQGLLELRLAMELHDDLVPVAAAKALRVTRDPTTLERVVPANRNRSRALASLAGGLGGPAKERFLRGAIEAEPAYLPTRRVLAFELVTQLEAGANGRCSKREQACRADATAEATALLKDPAFAADGYEVKARLARLDRDWATMGRELADCQRLVHPGECLPLAVEWKLQEQPEMAAAVAEHMLSERCRSKKDCGKLANQVAGVFERFGLKDETWRFRRRAAEELDTVEAWSVAASAAEKAGHPSDAMRIRILIGHRSVDSLTNGAPSSEEREDAPPTSDLRR